MTTEDDPDNDPLIKSMRSVWLGMREEDPPDRGFSELMAAARTQAAAMKPAEKAAWWRRSFAFLMRPPMLAAAAVVVVIGGAVALKGHGSNDAAMPSIESGLKQEREPSLEQERDGTARDVAVTKTETTSPPVVAPIGRGESAGSGAPVKDKVMRPTEKPIAPVQSHDDQFGLGGAKEDGKTVDVPPPPPPPPPKPDPGAETGLVIAGEGKDPNDVKTVKKPTVDKVPAGQQRPAPKADEDMPAIESTGSVRDGRVTVPTDQLVKQAEVAANRNDCPAVRATVARIKKASPETYKTKVVTQPAIARCLK